MRLRFRANTPQYTPPSARMTAGGGPCICKQYQTGPDGQSTCVKWSPTGCNDDPFMTATITTETPSIEPTIVATTHYSCTNTLNSLVGEYQHACVPTTEVGLGAYSTLNECLNSGCGGYMTCDSSVSSVNGISTTQSEIYPIPMCCESWINTSTVPLTTTLCSQACLGKVESWFPLYNVTGTNNFYQSPLSYLTRELTTYTNNSTCEVFISPASYMARGYTVKTIY